MTHLLDLRWRSPTAGVGRYFHGRSRNRPQRKAEDSPAIAHGFTIDRPYSTAVRSRADTSFSRGSRSCRFKRWRTNMSVTQHFESTKATSSASASEAVAGIVAIVLTILGLAHVSPTFLAAVATIAVGVALISHGGMVATE